MKAAKLRQTPTDLQVNVRLMPMRPTKTETSQAYFIGTVREADLTLPLKICFSSQPPPRALMS